MFVRVKKRKNKNKKERAYLYLVKSKYHKLKKEPKQKTLAYLGRIYASETVSASQLIHEETPQKSIRSTIEVMLAVMGYTKHYRLWKKHYPTGEITVDPAVGKVTAAATQKAVLAVNDGFWCDFTLQRLLNMKMPETTEIGMGKYLAKSLVEAGLRPAQKDFLALFQQIKAKYGLIKNQTIVNNQQQTRMFKRKNNQQ